MTHEELAAKISEALGKGTMGLLEASGCLAQATGQSCQQALEEILPDFLRVTREGAILYDNVIPSPEKMRPN